MLKVNVEVAAALRDLNRIEKQFRFATAVALTKTAQFAQMDLRSAVKRSFDRPTPFTQNSTRIRAATPNRQVAEVGFRGDNPEKHYLVPQIHGGPRGMRRFESWLRRYLILGPGEFVVPAHGFPLDAFGNVPKGVLTAILSDVQAHPDQYARSTRESRAKRSRRRQISKRAVYFVPSRESRLPPGIYQRVNLAWGSSVRGVLMFVRQPHYRVRLPLLKIVETSVARHLPIEMEQQLNRALATAR